MDYNDKIRRENRRLLNERRNRRATWITPPTRNTRPGRSFDVLRSQRNETTRPNLITLTSPSQSPDRRAAESVGRAYLFSPPPRFRSPLREQIDTRDQKPPPGTSATRSQEENNGEKPEAGATGGGEATVKQCGTSATRSQEENNGEKVEAGATGGGEATVEQCGKQLEIPEINPSVSAEEIPNPKELKYASEKMKLAKPAPVSTAPSGAEQVEEYEQKEMQVRGRLSSESSDESEVREESIQKRRKGKVEEIETDESVQKRRKKN